MSGYSDAGDIDRPSTAGPRRIRNARMTSELASLQDDFRREDSFVAAYRLIDALRRSMRVEDACDVLTAMTRRDLPPFWRAQFAINAYELGLNETSIALFESALPDLSSDTERMACFVDFAAVKFATGRYHEAHPIARKLRERYWLALQWIYISGGKDEYWWKPFGDRLLVDQPVEGRRVMVVHDQGGFGDLFQLIRYVDALRREGAARVCLSAPASVSDLMATKTGVEVFDQLLPDSEWDLLCPAFSLFARYQRSPYSPHWDEPYLSADPSRPSPLAGSAAPRRRPGRARIGVNWRSASAARHEPFRSMPLAALAPLLEHDGVDWVSLQVDGLDDDERDLLARLNVEQVGDRIGSFAETARAMQDLDLFIGVDSAPIHLAGALGRPAWAMLAKVADYRWCDDARFTPWYPSVRLFRQQRLGDWSDVVDTLLRQLRAQ
jgi:hypothetical protein